MPAAPTSVLRGGVRAGDRPPDSTAEDIHTDLLIIGAGPFGLSLAAYAQEAGIRHMVVGAPMGFWKSNMPQGMHLRSSCDWSLDPLEVHSIDAYLKKLRRTCGNVEPLSREFYLDYADWFRHEKDIQSVDVIVKSMHTEGRDLVALIEGGGRIRSRFIVLAIGFGNFAHVPPELALLFPRDRYHHTSDLVDFGGLKDRRVLIIGGRQSAFEWAALMREAGVAAVHLSYRHDTPSFTASDWRWVSPIVDRMADDPGRYRRLSPDEKKQLDQRFWNEGRLKLEPWLAPRIDHANIKLHPRTRVTGADPGASGIQVDLDSGEVLTVDHVVFATGYKVDLARVPLLANGLLSSVDVRDGFPVLNQHFQTSLPGLYITSLAATRDFGSFLAFTVSVRAQAKIIGQDMTEARCGVLRAC
jgi:cation diffusion facilitator CzcD-associated flavoprotein CzcO